LGSTSPSFTSVLLFFTLFSLLMWDCKNWAPFGPDFFLSVGSLCGQVRKRHPWGDAKSIKVTE
jgi:hypothetical protein